MSVDVTALRVAFVDGVTVSKWARVWRERVPGVDLELIRVDHVAQVSALRDRMVDMGFVRLPVDDDGLSVIPLYTETAFVVVAKDHPIALFDTVTVADLAGENRIRGSDDDAFALAAAGAGVVIVPQSIARLRSRRDIVARPVTDAPETRIGLAWRADDPSDRIEEFIGIVRGRTMRSSRGAAPEAAPKPLPPKKGAEKKAAGREAAGKKAAGKGRAGSARASRGRPRTGKR